MPLIMIEIRKYLSMLFNRVERPLVCIAWHFSDTLLLIKKEDKQERKRR